MDRREFLKAGVGVTLAGSTVSSATSLTAGATVSMGSTMTGDIPILPATRRHQPRTRFKESTTYDGAMGDLLA